MVTFWKTVWQFLIKLKKHLSYDPVISLLSIYPREIKTYVHTKICARIFIAPLFAIVKIEKQSIDRLKVNG